MYDLKRDELYPELIYLAVYRFQSVKSTEKNLTRPLLSSFQKECVTGAQMNWYVPGFRFHDILTILSVKIR